ARRLAIAPRGCGLACRHRVDCRGHPGAHPDVEFAAILLHDHRPAAAVGLAARPLQRPAGNLVGGAAAEAGGGEHAPWGHHGRGGVGRGGGWGGGAGGGGGITRRRRPTPPLDRAACWRLTVVGGLGLLASLICPGPIERLRYTFNPDLAHPIMRGFVEMQPLYRFALTPPYLGGLTYLVAALVALTLVRRFPWH